MAEGRSGSKTYLTGARLMSTPQDEMTRQLQGELDTDTSALTDLAKENKPEPFTEQPPQRDMGVMALSPYLIGIAVLGGKAAGIHAKTMLGAVNGMTEGLIKGSEQKYQDGRKSYDDAYQRWLDKFSLQQKLYAEMRQVYKGRVDADLKALEFARKATGDAHKVDMDEFKNWMQTQEYARKLQETNEKIDHNRNMEQINREKIERAKQAQAKKQAEKGQAIDGTIEQIDQLIAQLQASPDVAGARGYVTRGLETARTATGMGDQTDVHAHQFQTGMETLMTQLPKILTGSSKSAKDERARVDNIANALKLGSTGPIAIGKLNELKSILQHNRSTSAEEPDEHGFIVGKDYTNPKGQTATYLGDGQWQLQAK
jgi:hypothetical protein